MEYRSGTFRECIQIYDVIKTKAHQTQYNKKVKQID